MKPLKGLRALAIPLRPQLGLHEHDRTGVPFAARAAFQQAVRALFEHPAERVFGRESADEACDRFSNAINEINAAGQPSCCAVVAHGTVISLWLARHCGADGFAVWRSLGLPSAVVVDAEPRCAIVETIASVTP